MGVLPQALEIIVEVQRKRNDEKITKNNKKKKSFPTYKTYLFFFNFLLFGPLLFSNLIIFLFILFEKLNAIGAPPEVPQIIFEL
jgi:hypothetical protein